jgi:hypothetical protein
LKLEAVALNESDLGIDFEERDGWLVASISGLGWLPRLSEDQRAAFGNALLGLYQWAGVDRVREGPLPPEVEPHFRDRSIAWSSWVEIWERDQRGQEVCDSLSRLIGS